MANFYIYLIASLPMLQFNSRPPFLYQAFLEKCKGFIPVDEFLLLEKIPKIIEHGMIESQPTLNKYLEFEFALRNELAKLRSARKHDDLQKYLREAQTADPYIAHIALNAYRNPSIIEAEKILDQGRWVKLNELELGHFFDIDFLAAYAFKLLILERWEEIRVCDKKALFEGVLANN